MMDQSSENDWISQRNAAQMNTNDEENFEIETDHYESQSQSNYVQPENSSTLNDLQSETNNPNDSGHQDTNMHETQNNNDEEQLFDNNSEQCNTEASSGDELLRELKDRHGYDEYQNNQASTSSFSINTTKASGSSKPPLATVSVASSPVSNCNSAEQRTHLESFKNIIQAEVIQNIANNEDLMKNTDSIQLNDLVSSIVSQTWNQLQENFVVIPKDDVQNNSETDRKSRKRRKHHDDRHRSRGEKVARYSSTSSLDDLLEPSTSHGSSTPKRSDGNRGSNNDLSSSGSSTYGAQKRKQRHRSDNDFLFSSPRQPKANPNRHKDDHHQISVKKNTDKSLYLTSRRAKKCPLCKKDYKRMVSHFRRVHSDSEVFVSRVAPEMAKSLLQAQLPTPIKYANASGMQYLKMMCPFCDIEKDFYAPYWASHMRTHTGEYVNKCIECKTLSMNATHCGWPTTKPKCNLYLMGLTAYICIRCNYMQIKKKNIVSHLKKQHNKDRTAITSIENEYREIVLMPPLKDIRIQANPNDNVIQVPFMEQQPLITRNRSIPTGASSSGVQVIEDVLIRPRNPNPNPIDIVEDDSTVAERNMNVTESDAQYLYGFENGENDAGDEDMEITDGDTTTASGINYNPNIKVDTIDEQTLENVVKNYNQSVIVNIEMVRPWIEGDYGQKPLINVITQFALYKCMHKNCIFSTNSLENWFIHMTAHIQLMDFFKKRDLLDKSRRDELIKFRECSYCGYEAVANCDVLRHLEEEHHRSIFQCSLCFYRTIEIDNMVLHMNNCHSANGAQNEIYVCGDTREFNQQDEETLDQDMDQNVKKILCGQGGCTEEYACFNSLCAHLVRKHLNTGTYECPYCQQTMGLDESMIIDHLSKAHLGFEEFQCLKCKHGFDNVNAIREHMAAAHPSNYLFVGARRTSKTNEDEIQLIYVGDAQDLKPFKLMKCSQPEALNGMDPKVLDMKQQHERLQELHLKYNSIKTVTQLFPLITIRSGHNITTNLIRYERYVQFISQQDKKSIPSNIGYKCISGDMVNDVIACHIDGDKEIDRMQCETIKPVLSMIIHRFTAHSRRPMVFLHHQQQFHVKRIIRCTFQCELCAEYLATRLDLWQHFFNKHPKEWFAAKIYIQSQVIESNDPQQPIQMRNESFDYYFCSQLKCALCGAVVRTRTKAIEHYNDCHDDIGSKIDEFQVELCNMILHNSDEIKQFVEESKKPHQVYLFECQHCHKLFDSLVSIEQHFDAVRVKNPVGELRFVVKRLFRCLQDNVIRTYAGMKQYQNNHADADKKLMLPVNMQWPNKCCGLCKHEYKKNDDLIAHYQRNHIEPDAYSDEFLKSLGLQKIEMHLCKFTTGCCGNDERYLLDQIVDHAMNCERRFVCAQCPTRKFTNAATFVIHRIKDHDQHNGLPEIINELHNFKKILSLLSDVQIILPNGLVVAMKEIWTTGFGFELTTKIAKIANDLWTDEKSNFKYLMDGLHAV